MRRAACLQRPGAPFRPRNTDTRTHGAELASARTMLLCRPGMRLSAAALDHTNKSAGRFLARVKAQQTRGDGTLTSRKGTASQGYRHLCAAAGDSGRFCSGNRAPPLPARDAPPPAPGLADWAHRSRSLALNFSAAEPSSAFIGQPLVRTDRRRLCGGGDPAGNVLFTGNFGVSSQRCFSGTMQSRSASTSSSSKDAGEADNKTKEPEPEGGKLSKTQQLKKIFKEYGAVGVSFHVCISLMSLGMFYLLVSSGVDMAAVLCKVGFSEAVVRSKMAAGTSTFVLAYAIHKLFAPARISITLVSVPLIVRYFRKTGLFKPRTPSP